MSGVGEVLATGAGTVCRAWILRRRDGLVLGFTDHDGPLEIDGVTCAASSGMTAGALERSTGLSVDNVEASGALSDVAIAAEDVVAGRWDAAGVDVWLVDWTNPTARELTFRGTLGEIVQADGAFSVELRGLAEALNVPTGRVYHPRCDAVLGDRRCGVPLGPLHAVEIAVEAVEEGRVLTLPRLREFAPRWFERGRLRVLDGHAEGLEERVKIDRTGADARVIELWTGLRAPLVAGDRVRIEAGCDKLRETCRDKFGNVLNFRGFPDLPGEDWLMSVPRMAGDNDGGRG